MEVVTTLMHHQWRLLTPVACILIMFGDGSLAQMEKSKMGVSDTYR